MTFPTPGPPSVSRPWARAPWFRRPSVRFALHYLEMIAAMFAGMLIFGLLESGLLAVAGLSYPALDDPVGSTTTMTLYMTAGMAIWMRIRGHGLPGILEMSGAMVLPGAVLVPLLWTDLISGDAAMAVLHSAMFPLMFAVMLRRRDEYAGSHA